MIHSRSTNLLFLFIESGFLHNPVHAVSADDLWERENPRPHQRILLLASIEAMPEPDAPGNVKISTYAGHEMPKVAELVCSGTDQLRAAALTTIHVLQVGYPKVGLSPSSTFSKLSSTRYLNARLRIHPGKSKVHWQSSTTLCSGFPDPDVLPAVKPFSHLQSLSVSAAVYSPLLSGLETAGG